MTLVTVALAFVGCRPGLTAVADFIDEQPGDEPIGRDDMAHRRLDRSFARQEDISAEDEVRRLKDRYGRAGRNRYDAAGDNVPQRLLMPGVNDPSLWMVKVKVRTRQQRDGEPALTM